SVPSAVLEKRIRPVSEIVAVIAPLTTVASADPMSAVAAWSASRDGSLSRAPGRSENRAADFGTDSQGIRAPGLDSYRLRAPGPLQAVGYDAELSDFMRERGERVFFGHRVHTFQSAGADDRMPVSVTNTVESWCAVRRPARPRSTRGW